MLFYALDISMILEQYISDKLQDRRGQRGLWTCKIKRRSHKFADEMRIVILQPFAVEIGGFPAIADNRFHLFPWRRHDIKKYPPAIASGFIAKHFKKSIFARGQISLRILDYRGHPGFPLRKLRTKFMERYVRHFSSISAYRQHFLISIVNIIGQCQKGTHILG